MTKSLRKKRTKQEEEEKVIVVEKESKFAPRGIMRKFEISHASSDKPSTPKKITAPVVITD